MTNRNKEVGIKGEYEFIRKLNEEGIPYEYVDDWFDFNIEGEKVDVKTMQLTHYFKSTHQRIGRFTFTPEQRDHSLWYALFIRHDDEFLFLGMYKIKTTTTRHISLNKLANYKRLTLKEFKDKVIKKRSKNKKKKQKLKRSKKI